MIGRLKEIGESHQVAVKNGPNAGKMSTRTDLVVDVGGVEKKGSAWMAREGLTPWLNVDAEIEIQERPWTRKDGTPGGMNLTFKFLRTVAQQAPAGIGASELAADIREIRDNVRKLLKAFTPDDKMPD